MSDNAVVEPILGPAHYALCTPGLRVIHASIRWATGAPFAGFIVPYMYGNGICWEPDSVNPRENTIDPLTIAWLSGLLIDYADAATRDRVDRALVASHKSRGTTTSPGRNSPIALRAVAAQVWGDPAGRHPAAAAKGVDRG